MALTTRRSLLVRIKDQNDREAWNQFVDIYGPLIFRFGRRKGLQEADAADLIQEVLQRVLKSIKKFDYNPRLGKFRSWLLLISSQCLARHLGKKQRYVSSQSDSVMTNVVDQTMWVEDESFWDREYRQHILEWAMEQVRPSVSQATWLAFWETAIQSRSAESVAESLQMTVGAVYLAKSRIIKKLKQKIATVDETLN